MKCTHERKRWQHLVFSLGLQELCSTLNDSRGGWEQETHIKEVHARTVHLHNDLLGSRAWLWSVQREGDVCRMRPAVYDECPHGGSSVPRGSRTATCHALIVACMLARPTHKPLSAGTGTVNIAGERAPLPPPDSAKLLGAFESQADCRS